MRKRDDIHQVPADLAAWMRHARKLEPTREPGERRDKAAMNLPGKGHLRAHAEIPRTFPRQKGGDRRIPADHSDHRGRAVQDQSDGGGRVGGDRSVIEEARRHHREDNGHGTLGEDQRPERARAASGDEREEDGHDPGKRDVEPHMSSGVPASVHDVGQKAEGREQAEDSEEQHRARRGGQGEDEAFKGMAIHDVRHPIP
jgi:hypothetical protein